MLGAAQLTAVRRHQVCILDGNKYNARCREVGEQRLEILEECEVLHNQKRDPLLHSSACKNDYHHPQARLCSSLRWKQSTESVHFSLHRVQAGTSTVAAFETMHRYNVRLRFDVPDGGTPRSGSRGA